MFRKLKSWTAVTALAMVANLAWGVTLKDANFSSLPGDRTLVTLTFSGPPPQPTGYTIQQPARIALDLKGVDAALKSRYLSLGGGNAQSLTVVDAKDRTRLIFNLVQLVPYSAKVDGDQLKVVIGGQQGAAMVASADSATPVSNSDSAAAAEPSVTNVDFHRGDHGQGQVVVTFSNPKVDVDMSEKGGKIILRAHGVTLPQKLRRQLDVTDFATPVKRIDSYTEDNTTVISIKPEGTYDYLAYQTNNQFTVSVEKLTQQEADKRQKEKFPYTGEKLSLNFQDIEVRSVLQLIADFTGLNLVASDTVKGNITLRLQNVPWDQALDLILKTKGLAKRQVGNVLLVAPAAELAAQEKLEAQANQQISELAPLHLDIIQINYAKAADIVKLLKQDKDLISSRGFISSDSRTNTISVRETTDKLEQIRRLVTTWDVPVRQVLIEARIVRAQTTVSSDLGVRWGAQYVGDSNNNFVVGNSSSNLGTLQSSGTGFNNSGMMVDLGVTKSSTSSIAFGYLKSDYLIDLELSALESDGKAEIVAQPKVVTADRQQAKIQSGTEIPYQEASSSGATSVSFKDAVLSLDVTPQITPDDKIIMDLEVHQDSEGQVVNNVPAIDTNSVKTQVLVNNGETIVLGGIFQSQQTTTITKTPFLGDIPYLGRLFRQTSKSNQRSELLVFITPKIVKSDLTQ
nr:type IV pilus secretin PilQ family protein [Mangrovitalea sediminis]